MLTGREPALNFTFGATCRVGVFVSLLWIIGDALDGGLWRRGCASFLFLIVG
jgi:hypothetical protein